VAYLRFIISQKHSDSGVESGLFVAAYELRDKGVLNPDCRARLDEHIGWFRKNLAIPSRFNRSSSKGRYRRATRGIAWFRDSAQEHIVRMRDLKRIAEAHGYIVSVVSEDRIGYIVYEDENQVVAEPFAETKTGPRGTGKS
jgi:hypothetical protein